MKIAHITDYILLTLLCLVPITCSAHHGWTDQENLIKSAGFLGDVGEKEIDACMGKTVIEIKWIRSS